MNDSFEPNQNTKLSNCKPQPIIEQNNINESSSARKKLVFLVIMTSVTIIVATIGLFFASILMAKTQLNSDDSDAEKIFSYAMMIIFALFPIVPIVCIIECSKLSSKIHQLNLKSSSDPKAQTSKINKIWLIPVLIFIILYIIYRISMYLPTTIYIFNNL